MKKGGHTQLHTVCDRFGWRCYYCGHKIRCITCQPTGKGRMATRDHFVPRSKGGGNGYNLVASCYPCNQNKGDRDGPGKKPPTARSLGGCQYGRSYRDARRCRPHKGFKTEQLAMIMVQVIQAETGRLIDIWHCPGCGEWHLGRTLQRS